MGILFLTPVDATYISQANPNQIFGPTDRLLVGRSAIPGDVFRSLIQFDISSVPPGSLITNATSRLFLVDKEAPIDQPLQINRLLSDFSQSTVTWNTAPPFDLHSQV